MDIFHIFLKYKDFVSLFCFWYFCVFYFSFQLNFKMDHLALLPGRFGSRVIQRESHSKLLVHGTSCLCMVPYSQTSRSPCVAVVWQVCLFVLLFCSRNCYWLSSVPVMNLICTLYPKPFKFNEGMCLDSGTNWSVAQTIICAMVCLCHSAEVCSGQWCTFCLRVLFCCLAPVVS